MLDVFELSCDADVTAGVVRTPTSGVCAALNEAVLQLRRERSDRFADRVESELVGLVSGAEPSATAISAAWELLRQLEAAGTLRPVSRHARVTEVAS